MKQSERAENEQNTGHNRGPTRATLEIFYVAMSWKLDNWQNTGGLKFGPKKGPKNGPGRICQRIESKCVNAC